LDPLLRERRGRLFGILNGIDAETLDPSRDPYIPRHYDSEHLEERLENKRALQEEAGLPVDATRPLLGAISRLTDQKGFDLVSQVLEAMLVHLGIQFVLLGTGEERYHATFGRLAERYPQQFRAFLTFNTPLAQRIYAGTDMFLMPSRFEPCGLGQMIAMRYGSVPIVRRTGGLADTVEDYRPETSRGHGFLFEAYDPLALYAAVVRAVEIYRHQPIWQGLIRRGMQRDYSWGASAQQYVHLYRQSIGFAAQERAAPAAAS
jgi:starch synthase